MEPTFTELKHYDKPLVLFRLITLAKVNITDIPKSVGNGKGVNFWHFGKAFASISKTCTHNYINILLSRFLC